MNEAREAVERGARLLDVERPGWELEVDPDTLDMCSIDDCVLGQLWGRFGRGMDALFGTGEWLGGAQGYYGFDVARGGDKFEPLDEAWREAIRKRRNQRSGEDTAAHGDTEPNQRAATVART